MTRLTVLTVPDPRLRIKAQPIAAVDDEIRKLMDDMLETMYDEDGIGLAAIQVNVQKRVMVVDLGDERQEKPLFIANPELLWTSEEMQVTQEGCLSVPSQYDDVIRPLSVRLKYLDENNQSQILEASGLLADCIQHEIDHLNGKLFVDHLSPLKKKMALARSEKYTKEKSHRM